jgi:hypothetical protein
MVIRDRMCSIDHFDARKIMEIIAGIILVGLPIWLFVFSWVITKSLSAPKSNPKKVESTEPPEDDTPSEKKHSSKNYEWM